MNGFGIDGKESGNAFGMMGMGWMAALWDLRYGYNLCIVRVDGTRRRHI